jgi:ACS family hexuronate transporter-like MFS transporter
VGEILQRTGSYVPVFIIAGSAYLVAWAVIQVLTPRLEPVGFADAGAKDEEPRTR